MVSGAKRSHSRLRSLNSVTPMKATFDVNWSDLVGGAREKGAKTMGGDCVNARKDAVICEYTSIQNNYHPGVNGNSMFAFLRNSMAALVRGVAGPGQNGPLPPNDSPICQV